jgi:outer membrane receptor protein involved in Fe transport
VSYDITDNVQVFAQFDTTGTETLAYEGGGTLDSFTINSGNPFIPPSLQAEMTKLGVTSFNVNANLAAQIGNVASRFYRAYDQFLVGANGKFSAFGSQWSWDAHATGGTTRLDARIINDVNVVNAALAADVVTNPANGLPVCASTLINPNNGCVPFNPMGIGVNSQAAIDYVEQNGFLHQTIGEDVVSATVRGEPFADWAGVVSLAFGAVYRDDFVNGRSDPADEANQFFVGDFHPTNGSDHVVEGFVETVVPLLKDLPGAKQLDFNGAVRETYYSTSGAVTTWKLGLEWSPYSDLRFRATRSRDIRAPNLGELYSGGSTGTGPVIDPFKGGLTVTSLEVTTGNRNLQPEDADETTAGVVFQPSWFQGFSVSFDWYGISIGNSIATANPQTEINLCYQGVSYYCSLINLNTNPITIYIAPANTTFIKTQGFDIEASYTKHLADIIKSWQGALNLRLLATHIGQLTTIDPTGTVNQGAGANSGINWPELYTPTWKYDAVVSYDTDAFSASWTGRGFSAGVQDPQWIQCTTGCPDPTPPHYTINDNHMPGAFYMDLAFTYHLKREGSFTSDVYLTVENVANKNPDFFIAWAGLTPSPYDYLGRIFRAGVRVKM